MDFGRGFGWIGCGKPRENFTLKNQKIRTFDGSCSGRCTQIHRLDVPTRAKWYVMASRRLKFPVVRRTTMDRERRARRELASMVMEGDRSQG